LKIVKSPYLSEKSCDFDETWYTTSDIEPDDSHVTKKFLTFKMAAATTLKAAATTLKIVFFGHNSSTDCPISAQFCMRKHNGMATTATTKTANF